MAEEPARPKESAKQIAQRILSGEKPDPSHVSNVNALRAAEATRPEGEAATTTELSQLSELRRMSIYLDKGIADYHEVKKLAGSVGHLLDLIEAKDAQIEKLLERGPHHDGGA